MSAPAPQPTPKRGIVKQVLSGDSVVIRDIPRGGPPAEKTIIFSNVLAPKLARRATNNASDSKDEPYAWEAREFLRKKLIGETVLFVSQVSNNRDYGVIFLGKDTQTGENITETMVSEGWLTVRREGRAPEIARLTELEDAAKAANKGKWGGNPSEHIRDVKWSIENPMAFVDKMGGKPIKAIIENVRDGSTVHAFLLPDFYRVTLMISGIRAPAVTRQDDNAKPDQNANLGPLGDEAKFFVECRLLNRDIEIVLESTNNNNLVGSILHEKGNIAVALLREGFARCVDWSIAHMKTGADKLRAAEREAKEKRLRIWKDWTPTNTHVGKEYTATVTEVINGDALMVKISAQTPAKKIFLSSIRPPREQKPAEDKSAEEKPAAQSGPRKGRPLYDVPYMLEAREFLRKKLIGKRVSIVEDYVQPAYQNFGEKVCCTVTIGGVNVAEALVSKGLATVLRYRQDDDQRSSHYDELLAAETKASKSGHGLHSKKEAPVHRVLDVSGDFTKAKQFLPYLQRAGRTEGITEFVTSRSRMRLYLPKDSRLITLLLAGISYNKTKQGQSAYNEGEPFTDEEATNFTREKCMQREVQINVESMDRVGNYIGWLWVDGLNLSVLLVEEGLAKVHPSAEWSEHHRALKSAEDSAKARRIGVWQNYKEEDEQEVKEKKDEERNVERQVNQIRVVVTETTPELHFYAQSVEQGPKLESLMAKIRQEFQANPPLPGAYQPKKGDMCAAKFVDDEWYRAKVEKVEKGGNVSVRYVDYGNRETLAAARCAQLPSAFTSEKDYATEYQLFGVALPKDADYAEEALSTFRSDVLDRTLLLNVEVNTPPALATLEDPATKVDIGKSLIEDGLLLAEKRKERRLASLIAEYKQAQAEASKNHVKIWEYGDITEDDAKEFGLGP